MSLALYKPLGDNNEKVRLGAAKQLTSELAAILSAERTEANKKDVDYALKRLTRGLASGRESARPGFAVVLTEFLAALQSGDNPQKWEISLKDVIDVVKSNTQSQGHSGQEERDYWLGRLFGLQSLVQANILFASEEALQKYAEVLDLLFEVAQKKPWLMESSFWTIAASVPTWPTGTAPQATEITYRKLAESGLAKMGEGVGLWLALQAHRPTVTPSKDVWSKGSPLVTGSLSTLARVLKESSSKEDAAEGGKSKGSWNPKLGFVWDLILKVYFSSEESWRKVQNRKNPIAEWPEFWRVVVDDSLFANSSSEERKFWGFLFFLKSLDRVSTPADLSAMFSKNFMRCMINQLADAERYLNKAATKTSRALIAKAESAPWTAPIVFRELVTNHGTPNFDHITKSKTVDKILCSADGSGLVEIVSELRNVILDPLASPPDVDPSKVAEARRQWAADQILSVIRSGKTIKNESWLRKVVEIFTTFGYFHALDKKEKPAMPVSTNSQGMFRARLMSCLTHLIALKDVKQGEGGGESWPYIAFKTLGDLQGKKTKYKLAVEFDETISEVVDKATKSLEKLRKRRSSSSKDQTRMQLFSFELLYSLIILQVYNGESDALGVLEDLQSIQKKILTKKTETPKKPKKKSAAGDEDDEEVSPSEVLVDILLSFLSKPSTLLKRLAQTVFTSFCGSVTRGALERCFDVLATNEGMEGQATLFDDNDEENEGDEDFEEEQDSDVEMLSTHEEDEVDEGDSDSDFEVLSTSEEEDAATISRREEEQRKLEAALKTVLDVPQDADEDSDADVDDAEMLKLDEHIADIFRKQKAVTSKKSQKKEAKELIVHFKAKVLELLEIFVKNSPDNPLALEILLPCLVLARTTRDQKLQEKALNVVRTFAHSSKREGLPKLGEEHVGRAWKLLDHVHEEAGKGGQKGRRAACSSASILVVKTLVAHDPENLPRLSVVYAESMVRWVQDTKFAVENSFFSDFTGWAGSVRGKLGKQEEPEKKETKKTGKGKRKRNGDEDEEAAEGVLPALKKNGRGKNKRKRRNKGKN